MTPRPVNPAVGDLLAIIDTFVSRSANDHTRRHYHRLLTRLFLAAFVAVTPTPDPRAGAPAPGRPVPLVRRGRSRRR